MEKQFKKHWHGVYNKTHTAQREKGFDGYADQVVEWTDGSISLLSYKGEGLDDYASMDDFLADKPVDGYEDWDADVDQDWANGLFD